MRGQWGADPTATTATRGRLKLPVRGSTTPPFSPLVRKSPLVRRGWSSLVEGLRGDKAKSADQL